MMYVLSFCRCWDLGSVVGGCVGRNRVDGQGTTRDITRSKKRGGKKLGPCLDVRAVQLSEKKKIEI